MELFYQDEPFHNPVLNVASATKREQVHQVTRPFILTKDCILRMKDIFEDELNRGLQPPESVQVKGSLQQECTFIANIPDRTESGQFLSIDIGSTNFRVVLSELNPGDEDKFAVKYYDVPSEYREGKSRPLFDHLAACIADFVSERPELLGARLPLGFTFSYPCVQKAVDEAYLVTWTKSYDLPDAIGQNAVTLLREAIARRADLNIDVVAILNDTTGTLMMGAYLDANCAISMIFGSGFNACYLERVDRIKKLDARQISLLKGNDEVAVDIECGAFGDNGSIDFVKTDIDREIDQESLFVNSFSFEKMFSGNFLGDVTRRIFLSLTKKSLLFDGVVMSGLRTKDAFIARNAVQIEEAKSDKDVKDVLKVVGYGPEDISADDVAIVRYIVQIVANRGAALGATLLAALIQRIDKPQITVAFDGSLYKHHPRIKKLIEDYIQVLAPGRAFKLILAEDGSGKGAGVAAAVIEKQRKSSSS